MIDPSLQQAILTLSAKDVPTREISRKLGLSRNAVRRVLRSQSEKVSRESSHLELIRPLYARCRGNAVRIRELLREEHGLEIAYSTLTRIIREAHLREPRQRVGSWDFGPGEEMQHDTSPHFVDIDGKRVKAQCAALILAFSRALYVQYYPSFTRFEARCFLAEALAFFAGAAERMVIDNTSVILAAGSGQDAVIAPEVEVFAAAYGFHFLAHEIMDPKRKGRIERAFRYAEGNFVNGRCFESWHDLNEQAIIWCREVANAKEKRALGMSPTAALVIERPHLRPLPQHLPPVYATVFRVVDIGGYVNLDTNRYSVPDRLIGKRVEVHKYLDRVVVYFGGKGVANHPRLTGQRNKTLTTPRHHPTPNRKQRNRAASPEELLLRGKDADLDSYIDQLKKRVKGRGQYYFRRLLDLERTYPREAFMKALREALHYQMFDLTRLENLILTFVAGDFFDLDEGGDDPCI